MKELKLGIAYIGVESGNEELLQTIGKEVNYSQIGGAGRKAREAGITLSVTVILGLGGVPQVEEKDDRRTGPSFGKKRPFFASP